MYTYMYWDMCWNVFEHFLVSFKKFKNYVLFYQEPEPAPDKKFPEPPKKQAGSETLI